ncbi:MAG: galactonate dehydratase [Candidatus Poseidoniaceae archaeon]|nr:galactonate dehydratase [Candidatus Poseidoniaceae archaeon]
MTAVVGARLVRCPPRWLLIRIETEDGIIGWGEAIGDLHEEVEAGLDAASKRIIGEDSSNISRIVERLMKGRFWRDGPVLNTVASAVEMALWDIKGKRLGVPVWQLLGGKVRDKVLVYRNLWGSTPEEFADSARAALEEGLVAMKVSPAGPTSNIPSDDELQGIVEVLKAVRNAVGPAVKVAVDLHGRLSPAAARRLIPMLAEYDPWFIEEPCLPDDSTGIRLLDTDLPLATGERLLTLHQFKLHLEPPCVDIVQPDLSLVGGISAAMLIGELAAMAQVSLAPHCPYGPVQTAASLQIAAASAAHQMQEVQSLGGAGLPGGRAGGGWAWSFNLLKQPFIVEDGYVAVPEGAGLGIDIDEDAIAAHMDEWNPHAPPIWAQPDGAFAEW